MIGSRRCGLLIECISCNGAVIGRRTCCASAGRCAIAGNAMLVARTAGKHALQRIGEQDAAGNARCHAQRTAQKRPALLRLLRLRTGERAGLRTR